MSDSDAAAARRDEPAENPHPRPLDCCGGLNNVDFSKMDLTLMEDVLRHINVHDFSFCTAVIAIVFNPLFWNMHCVFRWYYSILCIK